MSPVLSSDPAVRRAQGARVWLISGCTSGSGPAIARAALDSGDRVVATAHRPEQLDEFLPRDGRLVHALPLDVTSPHAVRETVEEIFALFGRIDVLVNNGGHGFCGDADRLTIEQVQALARVMMVGSVELGLAVIPHMRELGGGTIVQLSPRLVLGGVGAYAAAMYDFERISDALARNASPLGVRVAFIGTGTGLDHPAAVASAVLRAAGNDPQALAALGQHGKRAGSGRHR